MRKYHTFFSAVHLFLKRGNKILLQRRCNTGYMDGLYCLVSGHIEASEPARRAMQREAKEEAGIHVALKDLALVHVLHRMGSDNERIDFFFEAKKWKGEPYIAEQHKCDDLQWFSINALPKNIIPYNRTAIYAILNGVRYSEHGWK